MHAILTILYSSSLLDQAAVKPKTHLFQYWNRNDKNLENEFHKLKAYYIYISNGLSNI